MTQQQPTSSENLWLRRQNEALVKTLTQSAGKVDMLHKMIIEQQKQILTLSAKLGAVLAGIRTNR